MITRKSAIHHDIQNIYYPSWYSEYLLSIMIIRRSAIHHGNQNIYYPSWYSEDLLSIMIFRRFAIHHDIQKICYPSWYSADLLSVMIFRRPLQRFTSAYIRTFSVVSSPCLFQMRSSQSSLRTGSMSLSRGRFPACTIPMSSPTCRYMDEGWNFWGAEYQVIQVRLYCRVINNK